MDALIQALLMWIAQNTHYETSDIPPPAVVMMSPTQITQEYYGDQTDLIPASGIDERIWALYDQKSTARGTIYLRTTTKGDDSSLAHFTKGHVSDNQIDDPVLQERLLHELIHHVQYKTGAVQQFPCPAYAEKEAYALGGKFFKSRYAEDPMPNRNFWAHVYSRC